MSWDKGRDVIEDLLVRGHLELGDRFVRGIVFHTGALPFDLDDRIWALPIAAMWA